MTYNPSIATAGRFLAYGDGSSGALTLTGSTIFGGFYTSLTLSSGTNTCSNAQVFCLGATTINGTYKSSDGGSASGSTGGSAPANNNLAKMTGGQSGVTTATTATSGTASSGYTGGTGGGGLSNGTQAATGGQTSVPANCWSILMYQGLYSGTTITNPAGGNPQIIQPYGNVGSAGGRGSGDGTNAGGGSGTCPGTIFLATQSFVGQASGAISSTAGTGAAGAAGTAGGGGGGGGGAVLTIADSYTGTAITPSQNGASGGSGQGGAGSGRTGQNGTYLKVTNV
jgi:hypothetical protein